MFHLDNYLAVSKKKFIAFILDKFELSLFFKCCV